MVLETPEKTESYASNNDEQPLARKEDDYGKPMMQLSTTHGAAPTSAEDDFAAITHAGLYMGDISMRRLHFPPSAIGYGVSRQSHSFEDNNIPSDEQSVVRSATRSLELNSTTITEDISQRPSISNDGFVTPDHTAYNQQGPSNTAGLGMLPTYPYATAQMAKKQNSTGF